MTDRPSGSRGVSRRSLQARGLLAVGAVAAASALVYGSYTQAFSDPVVIELTTSRAGLLLEPGADVSLRNVSIGEVSNVKAVPGGAVIELEIDEQQADRIDPASGANIVSPTLLGPKYVDILAASAEPQRGLRDGDVIAASQVQVEANAAFEDLVSVLDGVQPAQLNNALGAIATTLDGRGRQLGDYLEAANEYFARFNSVLPTMERDLAAASEVSRIYSQIAPELLAVLDSLTTTGNTVVSKSDSLDALLTSIQTTSDTTRAYLANNRVSLDKAMRLLRPTTTTLARYAPMFPCLFKAINNYRKDVEPASGGIFPGLWVHLTVLPGADPYDSATDLPLVRADEPTCAGAPIGPNGHYRPRGYDDGSPELDNTDAPLSMQDRPPLAVELFGTTIALPTSPGVTP